MYRLKIFLLEKKLHKTRPIDYPRQSFPPTTSSVGKWCILFDMSPDKTEYVLDFFKIVVVGTISLMCNFFKSQFFKKSKLC